MRKGALVALSVVIGGTFFASDVGAVAFTFETFQYPGASITTATGVNSAGQVVGIAQGLGQNIGFLKEGDVFTAIDVPGAGPLNGTRASGINDSGQIVGTFVTETGGIDSHGFVLDQGHLSSFDIPGAVDTQAEGINDQGQIVGRFFEPGGGAKGRGFIKDGDEVSVFDAPGTRAPFGTGPNDINSRGGIVGQFLSNEGFQSFLIDDGTFGLIEIPGAFRVEAFGINDLGQIVGSFTYPSSNLSHSFLITDTHIFQLDVPGVSTTFGTQAFGISDQGHIVGNIDVDGPPSILGFVARPCASSSAECVTLPVIGTVVRVPEPSSSTLVLVGFMVVGILQRKKRGASRVNSRDAGVVA